MEVPVLFALNERRALESSNLAPVLRELRNMYGNDKGSHARCWFESDPLQLPSVVFVDIPFDDVAALITALVYESFYAENSFWSPYFAMLPHSFEGTSCAIYPTPS